MANAGLEQWAEGDVVCEWVAKDQVIEKMFAKDTIKKENRFAGPDLTTIDDFIQQDHSDQFRCVAHAYTCECIEELKAHIRGIVPHIPSPTIRESVLAELNRPDLKPATAQRDTFHLLYSRWKALVVTYQTAKQAIEQQTSTIMDLSRADHLPAKAKDGKKVFVIHGRDMKTRDAMFAFLRSLGLAPMEWNTLPKLTGKASPVISDILDKAFDEAQAVVVLFTPDDLARLDPKHIKPNDPPHETADTGQARPNVLFEAGMAFGRCFERTAFVQFGSCRPFSDIGGHYIIHWDNSSMKRQELAQALEQAGCEVNMEGTDWHTAGNF